MCVPHTQIRRLKRNVCTQNSQNTAKRNKDIKQWKEILHLSVEHLIILRCQNYPNNQYSTTVPFEPTTACYKK